MSESTELVELSRGERMLAPLSPTAKYTDGITRHHRPFYDDYDVCKAHIAQAIGNIDEMDLFGRQVLIAVFCRPNTMKVRKHDGTDTFIYLPVKEIKEDWWQHKAALILKVGPEAFKGDDEGTYHNATFGRGKLAPQVGDWLVANPSAGQQMNLSGEGANRPKAVDQRGEEFDIFEWDGWPCRIVPDDCFVMRIKNPHSVV